MNKRQNRQISIDLIFVHCRPSFCSPWLPWLSPNHWKRSRSSPLRPNRWKRKLRPRLVTSEDCWWARHTQPQSPTALTRRRSRTRLPTVTLTPRTPAILTTPLPTQRHTTFSRTSRGLHFGPNNIRRLHRDLRRLSVSESFPSFRSGCTNIIIAERCLRMAPDRDWHTDERNRREHSPAFLRAS